MSSRKFGIYALPASSLINASVIGLAQAQALNTPVVYADGWSDSFGDQTGIYLDGNDAYTKILLHFDGADGSTTITDSGAGGSAHTWTANGNAQLDAGIAPKFGTAALLCDGTGDYVTTPDHADFALGSDAFTIDFWFNRAGGDGTTRYMAGQINSGGSVANLGFQISLSSANVVVATVGDGSTTGIVTGTTAFTAAGWHHLAFVRTGNTLKLFIDGVQEGGDVAWSAAVNNSTNALSIGRRGEVTTDNWNGSIDEFRYSVGIARWTSNFSLPTSAYGANGSQNAVYDSVNKKWSPATSGGTSYANTGGTGNRAGTSITQTETKGYSFGHLGLLLDGTTGSGSAAWTAEAVAGVYMQFDFGSAKIIDEFKWYQASSATHGTWKWQASNSASTGYVDIGTSFTLGGATVQTQAITGNTTSYRYWRLVGVSGTSSAIGVYEIEFKIGTAPLTYGNMSLVSTARDILNGTAPKSARLVVDLIENESITINTDVVARVCRNGSTYKTCVLTLLQDLGGGRKRYVDMGRTLEDVATGTSVRWKIDTVGKNVEVKAVDIRLDAAA